MRQPTVCTATGLDASCHEASGRQSNDRVGISDLDVPARTTRNQAFGTQQSMQS